MTEAVAEFLEQIDEMMSDGERYAWAIVTLKGIYDTVSKKKFATPQQRQAIKNIRERVEGTSERKVWSRRYEGMK